VDQLIRDRNYRSAESPHYRVQTDDPRLVPEKATELLESFWSFFEGFWSAHTKLEPGDERSRVFLFYSFYKYNQLLGADFTFSSTRPKGHYIGVLDVINLHTDADMPGGLADTLIHEAAHQVVDQRIYGHGVPPPMWIAEGLASYFGFTYRDKNGDFSAGDVGGKGVTLLRGDKKSYGREGSDRLGRFRGMYKGSGFEEGDLVEFIVSARDPDSFYFQNPDLTYATSWLLVHYLLHGDDGSHADAFARYLEKDAAGRGGPDVLYDTVGMSALELETAILAHVKRIKTR